MTLKELKEKFEELHIPDDAVVNCNCDHGQDTEEAHFIEFTRSIDEDLDACIWESGDDTEESLRKYYDDEDIDEYDFNAPIKQVVLCAE